VQKDALLVRRTRCPALRILKAEWKTKNTKDCRAYLVERTKARRNLGGVWGYFIAR
jgi:hypothetical protein